MSDLSKINEQHRRRRAVVYVRQSTLGQVERNTESAARQYRLRERAIELGWPAGSVAVVDDDTGRSGGSTEGRLGFKELVAEVGLGQVGLILALETSRLARSSADWHQLLDLCALTGTLIADTDGIDSERLQRSAVAGPEGHDVGGRAASDPRPPRWWAAQ
jgi:DNA invertase Pin-like site-specific DNA recombinase